MNLCAFSYAQNNTVSPKRIDIYKHIHGDITQLFCISQHIVIHNDKSTHISFMCVYFHIHNDNTF